MAAVDSPYTPLHAAAEHGHVQVVCRLLQAAPDAALQPAEDFPRQLPLHVAVAGGHVQAVSVLAAAEPTSVEDPDINGHTPVSVALLSDNLPSQTRHALLQTLLAAFSGAGDADEDVQDLLLSEMENCLAADNLAAVQLLLPCMRCSLALLDLLSECDVGTCVERSLFADLVERQPLSDEQWKAVPSPCPGLGAALPAVLDRSEAEAGRLVAHLGYTQRQRLRTAALCLHRASRRQLPVALSSHILCEVIAGEVERRVATQAVGWFRD